jgi:penicillin-binding protein 1B
LLLAACLIAASGALAGGLEDDLGRNETRIRSAPYPIAAGRTVHQIDLAGRLNRLGYERVRERPSAPGQYFWGDERFWIYRREHRLGGRKRRALLFGLELDSRSGRIVGAALPDGRALDLGQGGRVWLEPETLAESLDPDRAVRVRVRLDDLPEQVWRAVLAAEDARFFDHAGVDARSLARAAAANAKAGRTVQGGSTITQQLVKNRDLSPRRTMGRKMSEAVRALFLEAEYDKREILEAYLNIIYYGHVDGLAIYGLGTASRVFLSKPASRMTLAEAALMAAVIQGPNRLSPVRHPDRARERRDWVLGRMEEQGWATASDVRAARRTEVRVKISAPEPPPAPWFLTAVTAEVKERFERGLEKGRGVVVETTLDPYLQTLAEEAVRERLAALRRGHRRLRAAGVSAALVALDANSGAVLAYVGGDPADDDDRFDRARRARRQPGSSVKPLVLLEAFQRCGRHRPLTPASRVSDEPVRIDLPSSPWSPENFDGRYRDDVDVRTALRRSYNVPFVRIALWCGEEETAGRFERAGLSLPEPPPPSFALGSVEASPLEMAGAFTVFATPGTAYRPYLVRRIERPSGGKLGEDGPDRRRVSGPATAWLVRDLMRDAVEHGTGQNAAVKGMDVAGKTGTSSSLRDAWFVGHADGLVVAVWVGLDEGGDLGLTGGTAAAPIWRQFVRRAAIARPRYTVERPRNVVAVPIDPETGLRVKAGRRGSRTELFREGHAPPRKRLWRRSGDVLR